MRLPLSNLNSPIAVVVIVAVAYSFFLLGMTFLTGKRDPSAYVTAGSMFCDPQRVPAGLKVEEGAGYDGQFFYRFALDPFTSKITDFGVTLEKPAYRHQRILYPLLVWVVSLGGSPALVPLMMVLVNFFGLCVIGWLAGSYAQALGCHALWGLSLPLYPGLLMTLTRDLAEVVSISLLLGSLLLLKRNKHVFASLLICLALLARETILLIAVGAMLVYAFEAWSGRKRTIKWYYFFSPFAVFMVWQTTLFYNWGAFPISGGGGSIGAPFAGFVGFLLEAAKCQTHQMCVWFVELVFLIAFAALVIYCLRSTAAPRYVVSGWLLYFALNASLTRDIWIEDWGFLRALSEFYVLGALAITGAGAKSRAALIVGSLFLWLFLAYDIIAYR